MGAKHYRSAELIFGWSFYRQGTSGDTSSADEFLNAALNWFGDPDPRLGTAWEKGERLAKLVAHRRTLLVLDGLEPLQNPPGPQEGRVREPSLQALLRELAAFNTGLCVITTRTPVADIADYERTSALRRNLEQLSSDAGAKLLRALGVKGHEAELRSANDEFGGHCLALTLLGSYLTDAYNGMANSFALNKPRRGRNAISGSIIIIGRLRPSSPIISGTWSHFSQPSSVAAMPDCFERRCMKFTFREFSGEMTPLRLTFLAPEGHCSRF
jgi:hypothetical protein